MEKVPKKTTLAKPKLKKVAEIKAKSVIPTKKKIVKKVTLDSEVLKVKNNQNTKTVKKLTIKKVADKEAKRSEDVKLVPGTISLRLAEKRKLYEKVYQDYVPKVMRPIAITGGYAYITIGMFLALIMTSPALSKLAAQTATVLCFAGDCTSTSTISANKSTDVKPVVFEPLREIKPDNDTNLQLQVNVAASVRLIVLPISGQESLVIPGARESSTNNFNFLLPTATLPNGDFLLEAELYDDVTKQVRARIVGPSFSVQNSQPEPEATETPVEQIENNVDETLPEGEVLGVSTSTLSDEKSEDVSKDNKPLELNKEILVQESKSFTLTILPGASSEQLVFKLLPTFVFNKVELFAKPKTGAEVIFLGAATKSGDSWFYWLDNSTVPAGDYSLVVKGFENEVLSGEAIFRFSNRISQIYTSDAELNEIQERVNLLLEGTLDIEALETLRASYASSYLDENQASYPDGFLAGYLSTFDNLFANFASALAGKNEYLMILADDQLQKYSDKVIVDEVNADTNIKDFGHQLGAWQLAVKDSIRANEEELTKLSGGDSAFDIDFDGFTDYDEVVIYQTDPQLADTDLDGVLDSVEIIQGYSPLEAKLEAVSRSVPRQIAGIIDGEKLSISSIDPFFLYEDTSFEPRVLTSVTGRGIPNSFARLYLGDAKDVVVVRVQSDGSFTKTIDRDFAEIEGEIVLAIADNTGKIVMKGQPLQLEKAMTNKELFNSKALDAAVIKSVEEFKTINIIGAIGIVSFGLILLLLGKAIGPRRESISLEIA